MITRPFCLKGTGRGRGQRSYHTHTAVKVPFNDRLYHNRRISLSREQRARLGQVKQRQEILEMRAESRRENVDAAFAQALDFLSQDINEEMTHTCKERKGKTGRGKERRNEGWRFQRDEGWWLIPLGVDSAGNSFKRTEKGILIAVPSTFPKTLTYLQRTPSNTQLPPFLSLCHCGERGSLWNLTGPPTTHTHTKNYFQMWGKRNVRCVCVCGAVCALKMPLHPPPPPCSFLYLIVCLSCCHTCLCAEIPPVSSYSIIQDPRTTKSSATSECW